MAELLNRRLQLIVLQSLANSYPSKVDGEKIYALGNRNSVIVNICYLEEHKLIECDHFVDKMGEMVPCRAKVTARGLDFLADDGGLSAILGVVTIKLQDELVRDLFVSAVRSSPAPASMKDRVVDKLKSLPADALSKLMMEGLEMGLSKAPDLAGWLLRALD